MKALFAYKLLIVFWNVQFVAQADAQINVALGRPASQSSNWSDSKAGVCVAGRAVDGNSDPKFNDRFCSATNDPPGGPNWWRVDLGQPMIIKEVVINGRGDANDYVNRLDYFLVGVTNSTATPVRGGYPLCGQYPSKAAYAAKHHLQCNPGTAAGRYVIVQQPINGTGVLTICEIEVYAGQLRPNSKWHGSAGWRLTTNGTTVLKKRSTMLCINTCRRTFACDSINYYGEQSICELNFLPRGAVSGDLAQTKGWHWWTQDYEFFWFT